MGFTKITDSCSNVTKFLTLNNPSSDRSLKEQETYIKPTLRETLDFGTSFSTKILNVILYSLMTKYRGLRINT